MASRLFELKLPSATRGDLETKGECQTLDEATQAALDADLDLATAVIEKHGGRHPVNEWITFRIAGGSLTAG